jgi:hypothetical protein
MHIRRILLPGVGYVILELLRLSWNDTTKGLEMLLKYISEWLQQVNIEICGKYFELLL